MLQTFKHWVRIYWWPRWIWTRKLVSAIFFQICQNSVKRFKIIFFILSLWSSTNFVSCHAYVSLDLFQWYTAEFYHGCCKCKWICLVDRHHIKRWQVPLQRRICQNISKYINCISWSNSWLNTSTCWIVRYSDQHFHLGKSIWRLKRIVSNYFSYRAKQSWGYIGFSRNKHECKEIFLLLCWSKDWGI